MSAAGDLPRWLTADEVAVLDPEIASPAIRRCCAATLHAIADDDGAMRRIATELAVAVLELEPAIASPAIRRR